MVAATESNPALSLSINDKLFRGLTASVEDALTMCHVAAQCVGVSSVPTPIKGTITGLIGVHGSASGFVTVNCSERLALKIVGGLLQDEFSELSAEIIDGMGEVTNIIAGGIKARLSKSEYQFNKITIPSVILGDSYEITYAKGLDFICAMYDVEDPAAITHADKVLRITISVLRL